MDGVTRSVTGRRETAESRVFSNDESMMPMVHAVRMHGMRFRVSGRSVTRQISAGRAVCLLRAMSMKT
ncbi:hypothetical protein [Burkholderia sp.]|uniref:hypothetical protein n=1 Tax=Burkholderia sp. TaxID=36773 RepID=UPI0025BDC1FB|nr:hypothetical protein [Burkholderia sp.]MBS6361151.1 hypothetical protein [Burkholderia sp.]